MAHLNNSGAGDSGTASVPRGFGIVSRCMQEAVQELLRALEERMEERLNLLEQRVEERVATLAQRVEEQLGTLAERLSGAEARMMAVEATDTVPGERNGGQEAAVKKLEERMQQLEASVQRALDGVIPRVDTLLQQLEDKCPPAPFAVPSTSSARPPPRKRSRKKRRKTPSASTSSPQPCALPSVSSAARTSTTSPSPSAPSPAVPSPTPSTASAPSPTFSSDETFARGEYLCDAAEDGRVRDVQRLLNEGANVDYRSFSRGTPLMRAADKGHADVVSLLLERGADINAKTADESTALHFAALDDRSLRCLQLLIDGGAHVQCKSIRGWTALHRAAMTDNEQAVRLLIAAGAYNTDRDRYGNFPSDYGTNPVIREIISSSRQPPP